MPNPQQSKSAAQRVKSSTSCVAIERASVRFEDITYAANCVNELLLEWIIDFCAQSPDNDIHDIGIGIEVDVPYVLGDFFARNDLAGGASQLSQEQEFLRREIECDAAPGRAMAPGVDFQIFNP